MTESIVLKDESPLLQNKHAFLDGRGCGYPVEDVLATLEHIKSYLTAGFAITAERLVSREIKHIEETTPNV